MTRQFQGYLRLNKNDCFQKTIQCSYCSSDDMPNKSDKFYRRNIPIVNIINTSK